MGKQPTTIILGDEYDDVLRDVLREILVKNGAVSVDKSWGVGGSQEIATLSVQLGNDVVSIEAETFVGLMISGPKALVEDIAQQVLQRLRVE